MLNLKSLTVLVFACSINVGSFKKLPSYIHPCRRYDPNIDDCLRKNVEILTPHLLHGIPELFLPPLNPLVLPEATLNNGDSFNATFRNIEIFDADKFVLEQIHVDLKALHCDLKIHFPKIRIKSNFVINGRILILQLNGQGPADGNFTNIVGTASLNAKLVDRNGKRYISWEDKQLDVSLGKPVFRFERIFGDNEELNDQTNKIVNDNVESLIEELRPVIRQVITQFIFGIINRVFEKYTIDELFPK